MIKDIWIYDFIFLYFLNLNKILLLVEFYILVFVGLGKKKIVFFDKRGDFSKLRVILEKEYFKLIF